MRMYWCYRCLLPVAVLVSTRPLRVCRFYIASQRWRFHILSRASLESSHRGRIDDDMESKEGRPYGRDEDLCRWAAAAAPELGPIGLVVEDHGRSGQGRNNIYN